MKLTGVFLALIFSVILIVCLLISPAYLGDYRWIFVALPVLLVIVREVYEHVPGSLSHSSRRRTVLVIEPLDEEDDSEEKDEDETDASGIIGLWTGTARIWPSTPADVLQVLPVTLAISDIDRSVRLISAGTSGSATRIVQARLLEHDTATGNIDLELIVESEGRQRSFDTKLLLTSCAMLPDYESDPVTVELRRARFTTAIVETENR